MACEDVLSLTDLQTAKKHDLFHNEVITGKAGGVAGGADIATATNQATGQVQTTLPETLRQAGFKPAGFTFVTGGTLAVGDHGLAVYNPAPNGDNNWYAWGGPLPKTVPAGSTPQTTGGFGVAAWSAKTDVILRPSTAEALRRTYAEAGYQLIPGSFEAGGTINTETEVLLFELDGKAYSWGGALPKIVPAGSTPTSAGGIGVGLWNSASASSLRADLANVAKAGKLVAFKRSQIADAVASTIEKEISDSVTPITIWANGDGVFDNADALDLVSQYAILGIPFRIPKGTYATSRKWKITDDFSIIADRGARIKYIGATVIDAVIDIDFTGGLPGGFAHGGDLRNLIIDGNGKATDGLVLRGVVSGMFKNIRVTNVTRAGLGLRWAQLCLFENYECSNNIEAFTTTPVNGILVDTASSSANTFINPTIEHVSGQGLLGKALINSLVINGTIEGNNIGVELGEAVVGSLTAIGNTFIGCDMEVNAVSDVVLLRTASANDFISLKAGFNSGQVRVQFSIRNRFIGGVVGGIDFDANSSENYVDGVSFLGSGRTVTDAGTNNSWRGLYNITTATKIKDKGTGRANNVLSAGQTAPIDASSATYHVVTCTGATATIGAPTKFTDGQELEVCIHNTSGVALTVTWNGAFKMAGWVSPATGFNRTARFRYDSNYGFWYQVSVTAADVPN